MLMGFILDLHLQRYNLQSHKQKLVEDRQKCLVAYPKKGNKRGMVGCQNLMAILSN